MPRGPKGEKRPADVIGNAVHVMRIATGETEDKRQPREMPGPAETARGQGGLAGSGWFAEHGATSRLPLHVQDDETGR